MENCTCNQSFLCSQCQARFDAENQKENAKEFRKWVIASLAAVVDHINSQRRVCEAGWLDPEFKLPEPPPEPEE